MLISIQTPMSVTVRFIILFMAVVRYWLFSHKAVFQGGSRLVLGRERHDTATGGVEVDVKAGDVIVVPAGVSHRSLSAYGDYRYIGVYPEVRLPVLSPQVL